MVAALLRAFLVGLPFLPCSQSISCSERWSLEEAMIHALTTGRGGLGTPIFAAAGDETITGVRWPAASPWTAAVGMVTEEIQVSGQETVRRRFEGQGVV